MDKNQAKDKPFYGVALFLILVGIVIFAVSGISWLFSVYGAGTVIVSSPFTKIIGGLIVMALGYIQLELELLRR